MLHQPQSAYNDVDTDVIDTKAKAVLVYRALAKIYGPQLGPGIPVIAQERLALCEEFLNEKERREALAML